MFSDQQTDLTGTKKAVEADGKSWQTALLMEGIRATGRSKSFRELILERPKDPCRTIATRELTLALSKNSLQNHGKFGILVPEKDLKAGLNVVFIPVRLQEYGVAGLYVYSDLSCTIAFPSECKDKVRAVTLPFRIRSAHIRPKGNGEEIRVSIRDGVRQFGILIREGNAKSVPLNGKTQSHKYFLADLAVEIEAVLLQMRREAPIYTITPARVRESEKGPEGQIRFPAGPKMYYEMSQDELGWLMRGEVSNFDMHLPYMTLTMEQIYMIRGLSETISALAWRRVGLSGKSLPASLVIRTGSPVSGEGIDLAIEQSTYDRYDIYMRDDFSFLATECEKEKLPREEEVQQFLNEARDLLTEATHGIKLYGYRISFAGGWKLAPIVLAEVGLNDLSPGETEETLIARYAFQTRRLSSLSGVPSKRL